MSLYLFNRCPSVRVTEKKTLKTLKLAWKPAWNPPLSLTTSVSRPQTISTSLFPRSQRLTHDRVKNSLKQSNKLNLNVTKKYIWTYFSNNEIMKITNNSAKSRLHGTLNKKVLKFYTNNPSFFEISISLFSVPLRQGRRLEDIRCCKIYSEKRKGETLIWTGIKKVTVLNSKI